jgi:regulatory protein
MALALAEARLRARALRLLARREHSRAELRRKLAPQAREEGVDLDVLLEDFARRGWLSEERFVEQAVRTRAQRYGPLRIAQHLRDKGIDEAGIERGLAQARAQEDEALARAWRTRFGRAPGSDEEKANQVRFLQQRGFTLDAVLRFLRAHVAR